MSISTEMSQLSRQCNVQCQGEFRSCKHRSCTSCWSGTFPYHQHGSSPVRQELPFSKGLLVEMVVLVNQFGRHSEPTKNLDRELTKVNMSAEYRPYRNQQRCIDGTHDNYGRDAIGPRSITETSINPEYILHCWSNLCKQAHKKKKHIPIERKPAHQSGQGRKIVSCTIFRARQNEIPSICSFSPLAWSMTQ